MNNISTKITNLARVFILALAIFKIYIKDYSNFDILIITMFLTFYDLIFKKVLKIRLNEKTKVALIVFIFATEILGTYFGFYDEFQWWDSMLHCTSGIIFFFIGELIINQINEKTSNADISKYIIIIFALCLSLATGVLWEIFEFTVDSLLNKDMQITKGLVEEAAIKDTMIDLIALTLGSVGTSIIEIFKKRSEYEEKNCKQSTYSN